MVNILYTSNIHLLIARVYVAHFYILLQKNSIKKTQLKAGFSLYSKFLF